MEFLYGDRELAHLRARDAKLAAAIDRIGHVSREVDTDLFSSVIHHIIGQQVSTAAQRTVWRRFLDLVGREVTAERVCARSREELQALGMTWRKADYILDFAGRVRDGSFAVEALNELPDDAVRERLSSLRGIGPWTAEMLMIFACSGRTWSAMAIWPSSGGCGCCTGKRTLTARPSTVIGNGTAPMAPLPACTCGPLQAAPCRS